MSTPKQPIDTDDVPEAVVDEDNKGLPVVWILPLVALLIGGWLLFKTVSEKGPEITITFETAEGIEEGKTLIKYRDVAIGKVSSVDVSDDLSGVELLASMVSDTEDYMTEHTRFWVVRPRVGVGGVSGLGTLLSGAYIAMEPSTEGKGVRKFKGLEKPPVVTSDRKGTFYRLKSERLGSLSIGAPVYFRQFDVGEVTDYELVKDHSHVEIGIFISDPHDQYIREGTHFWNVSGISAKLDASGVTIDLESVAALVGGGIAFDTLPKMKDTPLARPNSEFTLYDDLESSLERPITRTITYVLRFDGSLRGISSGAPVEFRGIRMGSVKSIELGPDKDQAGAIVPLVVIDIEPERALVYGELGRHEHDVRDHEFETETRVNLEKAVAMGLRARLQSGNLITGQQFIELDYFPNADPATVSEVSGYPEIPTLPSPIDGMLASLTQILDRLEQAPLDQIMAHLNDSLSGTAQLMARLNEGSYPVVEDLRKTLNETQSTLQAARQALKSYDGIASTDGEIGSELYKALTEISTAARSLRVMAEYLERHPDALLKGKNPIK